MYQAATNKAAFDAIDVRDLPRYLKESGKTYALFDVAHGVPEFVITDETVCNTVALPRVMVHEDPVTHDPRFVFTPDLTSHNAVAGVPTRYMSTGLTQRIRGGRVLHTHRLVNYTLADDPPVWHTKTEDRCVALLLDPDARSDETFRVFLSTLTPASATVCTWLPVHTTIRHHADSWSEMADFDGTPSLALAFVLRRTYIASLLLTAGASLCTRCPPHHRGEEDPPNLDVAQWLATWFRTHQTSTATHNLQDVANTVTLYGNERDIRRMRALTKATRAPQAPSYTHAPPANHPHTRRRCPPQHRASQRRARRKGGEPSAPLSSRRKSIGRSVSRRSQRHTSLSPAVRATLDHVYSHRRILQNAWEVECDCSPFETIPAPKVVVRGENDAHADRAPKSACAREIDHVHQLLKRMQIRSEAAIFGRMPLETWMLTYQVAQQLSRWDIEGQYHYNKEILYSEVVGKLTHPLIALKRGERVLRYRYLARRTPQEIITRQFYLNRQAEVYSWIIVVSKIVRPYITNTRRAGARCTIPTCIGHRPTCALGCRFVTTCTKSVTAPTKSPT